MVFLKIISAAMALLFIAWAVFQYNDPDPFIWILVYGIAALASILFLVNRLPFPVPMGFLVIGVIWAMILLSQAEYPELSVAIEQCKEEMSSMLAVCSWIPQKLMSEKWREMGGLLFVSSWMGILAIALSRKKKE